MRTLLLLRHAKSSWKHADLPDHDRPLNARGKRDAPRMGRLMRRLGLDPDMVLASSATRARRTAAEVARCAEIRAPVETDPRLYLATPGVILDVVHERGDEAGCVLVVGHNPGLEELVARMSGAGTVESFPTAALARIELDLEAWTDLSATTAARRVRVWRPKELTED